MMHKLHLNWFILLLFAASCARQSSPTGGPKDTIPPILVKAIPENESVNFNADNIELIFSEDVILNSPKEQLIVTPTIGKDYKITYRKNVVKLQFDQPLADSTTYTFNFRETVQDITEKNPVRNLTLAYSTGTYIDSLSIEGTVFDLITGKEIKDATVALNVVNDTFNIFEHPAIYFTKTDDKGRFKISHLKPDNYFLYAFQDKNRNLIVNSRSESYGFLSEDQYLLENITDKRIGLTRLDAGPLKITSARPYNTYFNIRTSKNLRTYKLTAADSSDLSHAFGEDQSNIRIYKTTGQDSLLVHVLAIDSIDNAIDTSLYVKYLTREVTPEAFKASLTASSLLGHTGQLQAKIVFTKPLKEVNFDSMYFQVDSLTRVQLSSKDLTYDPPSKTVTISKTLDRNLFANGTTTSTARRGSRTQQQALPADENKLPQLNELNFRPAAFISIENDSSEQIVQPLKPLSEQNLSIINIEIRTEEPTFLVQLLDSKLTVVKEVRDQHQVRFTDVIPGEYQIRLIIDRNKNRRWDPGNYFTKTEPEPIIYYKASDGSTNIKGVKENWEVGTDGEMFITYE